MLEKEKGIEETVVEQNADNWISRMVSLHKRYNMAMACFNCCNDNMDINAKITTAIMIIVIWVYGDNPDDDGEDDNDNDINTVQ